MRTILFWLLLLLPSAGAAKTHIYTFHVGVNAPPPGSGLPVLHYADDDAARFYSFVRSFATRSTLITVLDGETQRRFPDLASRSIRPSREYLSKVLARQARLMQVDREQGNKVVVYFSYSGHGLKSPSGTRLSLLDNDIDRNWLEQHLLSLPVDYLHLFIDACYAEGLVESKGLIKGETSATSRTLTTHERHSLLHYDMLQRHPHIGVLLATASGREAHEWSRIQSGVFTHEVLSALAGAADVNADGKIAYSEVAAFVSAANSSIEDSRAAVHLISRPPRIDRNAPIVDLSWISKPTLLTQIPSALGHFYLESERGVRLIDAHRTEGTIAFLLVPDDERIWLRTGSREANFVAHPREPVAFRNLRLQKASTIARGSIDHSLRQGFFQTPFGVDYYRGWIDQQNEISVPLAKTSSKRLTDSSLKEPYLESRPNRAPSISCMVAGGVTLATAIVFGALAIKAKSDLDATDLQAPPQAANDRLTLYSALSIGSAAVTAGLGVLAWWLWPNAPSSGTAHLTITDDSGFFGYSFPW